MKCEVIFLNVVKIDQENPEQMVIHQFAANRDFTVTVPLLMGCEPCAEAFIYYLNLGRNKRASVKYVEFFLHKDFSFIQLKFRNYLIIPYYGIRPGLIQG